MGAGSYLTFESLPGSCMRRLRYIEYDGQVYLVQRDGVWTFPSQEDELDFEVDQQHATTVKGDEVTFCRARLPRFPTEWHQKDAVASRHDVDPVVLQSINASLARCVVAVLVENDARQILVVKSNRGFAKGLWNAPGGFVEYGEHPEEAAIREIKEETNLDILIDEFVGVYMHRFGSPYFMYGFVYRAHATTKKLILDATEIDESKWVEPSQALPEIQNPFAASGLRVAYKLA